MPFWQIINIFYPVISTLYGFCFPFNFFGSLFLYYWLAFLRLINFLGQSEMTFYRTKLCWCLFSLIHGKFMDFCWYFRPLNTLKDCGFLWQLLTFAIQFKVYDNFKIDFFITTMKISLSKKLLFSIILLNC